MTMRCEEARPMIELYADGELELSRSLELERHLDTCPSCTRALAEVRSLTTAVRGSGIYGELPQNLTSRVVGAVAQESGVRDLRRWLSPFAWQRAEEHDAAPIAPVRRPSTPKIAWWRPVAIGVVALAILAVFAWRWVPTAPRHTEENTLLTQEVLDSHVRSMMADHLYDVPSTDQHTVKPWFDGKVDFAPPVVDLTTDGFELAGGRLDYINGRPVATTVYRRRKHVINLFMWPESTSAPLTATMRNGYNLLHWQTGGLEYWAVSDLNPQELREFVTLLQAKVAPR